jgi:predicted dehydrogenase
MTCGQITTFLQQWLLSQPSAKNLQKERNPVRFGILSTAMINPAALIHPVETHGDAVITAIASRDKAQAEKYAKKYSIEKAYGSYEELLADPNVDAVYISLPNGMHAEWAKKTLAAGKHALVEKPFCSNADEAVSIIDAAKRSNKVAVEALHWRFHPAAHVVKELVRCGKYGNVLSTYAKMTTPAGSITGSNIRWQWDLGGGSLMDMTYTVSATRFFLDAGEPETIEYAKARTLKKDSRVDEAMNARVTFKTGSGRVVSSEIYTDMNQGFVGHVIPKVWEMPSIRIELEHAIIYYYK